MDAALIYHLGFPSPHHFFFDRRFCTKFGISYYIAKVLNTKLGYSTPYLHMLAAYMFLTRYEPESTMSSFSPLTKRQYVSTYTIMWSELLEFQLFHWMTIFIMCLLIKKSWFHWTEQIVLIMNLVALLIRCIGLTS